MKIGMSLACFYPREPENVVSTAAELGIDQCEVFLNTFSELEPRYLHSLRETCDQAGIRVYSVHPFTSAIENYFFFSPYPRRIADAKELYRRYAVAAEILGAGIVNIHGDRGLGLENYDQYVDCLKPLLALQDETGIIFSLENVFYNSVNHPEFAAKLRQGVRDVRFTFDVKQANKGNQDPYDVLNAMGNAIVNFHANDYDGEHICLLPGQGVMDYKIVFSQLKSFGYNGPALIEVYRYNFDDPTEIAKAKHHLENELMLAK